MADSSSTTFDFNPTSSRYFVGDHGGLVGGGADPAQNYMRGKPIIGTCRLCHQTTALVDSHIIPKFHLKPLKKREGHYYILSTDPKKPELKEQKGITEHLLCAKCDNERVQRNEEHLARVICGGYPLDGKQDSRVLRVTGYNYQKVKNGLLSILWRMSIASDPYFKDVQLGPKHEENIRQALLLESKFGEEEYPILLTAPFFEGKFLGDWILPPDPARVGHNRVYRCLISGLLFTFFIGSAPIDETMRPLILRENEWPIIRANVDEVPFLLDACTRVGKAHAVREASSSDR
jgi:hypothetical protein